MRTRGLRAILPQGPAPKRFGGVGSRGQALLQPPLRASPRFDGIDEGRQKRAAVEKREAVERAVAQMRSLKRRPANPRAWLAKRSGVSEGFIKRHRLAPKQ